MSKSDLQCSFCGKKLKHAGRVSHAELRRAAAPAGGDAVQAHRRGAAMRVKVDRPVSFRQQ